MPRAEQHPQHSQSVTQPCLSLLSSTRGKADVSYFQLNLAELLRRKPRSQGLGEHRSVCALPESLLQPRETAVTGRGGHWLCQTGKHTGTSHML